MDLARLVETMGADGMREWWRLVSAEDAELFCAKAAEYGSVDLKIMGDTMISQGIAPENGGEVSAIMFYALGKVARAISALNRGDMPSDDTLKDLCIYAMMARWHAQAKSEQEEWDGTKTSDSRKSR